MNNVALVCALLLIWSALAPWAFDRVGNHLVLADTAAFGAAGTFSGATITYFVREDGAFWWALPAAVIAAGLYVVGLMVRSSYRKRLAFYMAFAIGTAGALLGPILSWEQEVRGTVRPGIALLVIVAAAIAAVLTLHRNKDRSS